MRSFARANIEYEWRKFFAASTVLAGAAVLLYLLAGPLLAKLFSIGEVERQMRSDITISKKHSSSAETIIRSSLGFSASYVNPEVETRVLLHPNVERVEAVGKFRTSGRAAWITSDGRQIRETFYIVNTDRRSLSFPKSMNDITRAAINTPTNIVLTPEKARQYGVNAGDVIHVGDNRLHVSEITDEFSIGLEGVFLSRETAIILGVEEEQNFAQYYLVALKDAKVLQRTQQELRLMLEDLSVNIDTPSEMATNLGTDFLRSNLQGLLIANLIAALIICLISGQTLRSLLMTYRSEFGALRALGVRSRQLSGIAMEQSFWLGLFSISLSLSMALVLKYWFESKNIAFVLPIWLILSVSVMLMIIAFLSGLFSLAVLSKVKPVELLR